MRTFTRFAGLGLLGTVLISAQATAAIVVDGSLTDWSVIVQDATPGTSNGSVFAPSSCPVGGSSALGSCVGNNYDGFVTTFQPGNTSAVISSPLLPASPNTTPGGDRNDWTTSSYLHGIGAPTTGGGQNYDVDAMMAAVEGTKLVGAISTGQRADNGLSLYSPGDLRIQVTKGNGSGTFVYGIEIGGGLGHTGGAAVGAFTTGDAGWTYTLNSNGHTTSAAANGRLAGDVVLTSAADWILDPIGNDSCDGSPTQEANHGLPGGECQVQLKNTGGSTVGAADVFFTVDTFTTQHSVIEFALDLSLIGSGLGAGDQIDIFWGPSCANDYAITVIVPGSFDIPAPAALPMFLLGLGGLGFLYRRRRAA